MRSEKWYSSLSLALTVWILTSFSAPYWGGTASGKPSCKGTETPATDTETKHCLRKGNCIALAGMKLIFLAGASTVLSCLLDLNHDRSQMESKIIRISNKTRHGHKTNPILSQALTSFRGTGNPGRREGQRNSPGARGGTGGAVQAALWQRPAEICRTFLPCSTVTSVGSRTWFVWPSPSCRDNSQLSEQQLTADAKTSYLFTTYHVTKNICCIYIFSPFIFDKILHLHPTGISDPGLKETWKQLETSWKIFPRLRIWSMLLSPVLQSFIHRQQSSCISSVLFIQHYCPTM